MGGTPQFMAQSVFNPPRKILFGLFTRWGGRPKACPVVDVYVYM